MSKRQEEIAICWQNLRRELAEVPMTTSQRMLVDGWLEMAKPDEGETAAVRAIETLTNCLGGIDSRWHNYQAAADHAVRVCRGMLRIAGAIPRPMKPGSTWDDIIEQAVLGLSKLKDHRFIIETKEQWQKDDADDDPIAGGRQRVVAFLRALQKPVGAMDPLMRRAFEEIITLLDHVAGEDIPF